MQPMTFSSLWDPVSPYEDMSGCTKNFDQKNFQFFFLNLWYQSDLWLKFHLFMMLRFLWGARRIWPTHAPCKPHLVFQWAIGPRCPTLSPLGFVIYWPRCPTLSPYGLNVGHLASQTAFSNWGLSGLSGPNIPNRGSHVTCLWRVVCCDLNLQQTAKGVIRKTK